MITALSIIASVALTAVVWFAIAVRHDQKIWAEHKEHIDRFEELLRRILSAHDPEIHVYIARNSPNNRMWAAIRSNGHTYQTSALPRLREMVKAADEAATFFNKKQLMKWIPHD